MQALWYNRFRKRKEASMPRPRIREDRPLSSTERVQRFRSLRGERRLEILLDVATSDQVTQLAERWGCSRQEVLKIAFQACLPAMRQAASAQGVLDKVQDSLEAIGASMSNGRAQSQRGIGRQF